MAPTNYGVAALAVVLFYVASSSYAKPLTQSMELSAADRVHYFGQAEVQDFELVSPQVSKRRRHATQGNHIEAKKVVFEAFDERFDIALEPKVGLVDAGTLVHEVGKDGKTVLSQPKEYCLYVGKSLDHKDSTVSASDCGNKLQASIATDKAAFQLQPLKTEHKEKDGPTHMVVRRSVNTQACNMDAERSLESTMSRRKRSTAEPIYVDASVVADDLMYKTYGNETNNYLLTILNQVAGLLKDPSLDVQVNLKISNIKIVKTPQLDLSLSEDLEKSLKSFCSWQKKSDSDISILITRRDLVSGGNHKVTGKAADVGGACDPKRRCLIGQDHGPSGLIFTLAHEIGHSLGMYHDGGLSDCVNKKNIMASVNSGGPEAFRWSECSNNDLLNFLARPESKCLKDKSKSRPDYTPSSIPMPGFYFNATEQCAMTYNAKSTVASEVLNKKEICTALVCKNGNGIPESTNVPPLDGTRCGTKRDICIHGECLKVYSTMDCEGGPCIPFWLAGSYTCQNSTTCVAIRSVLCVEEHDDGTTRRVLDLSRCPNEVPTDTGICPDDPCRFAFITGEYGTCSVTCGTGVQVRNVVCQDRSQEIPTIVNDALCQEAKPLTTQVCVLPACPVNSYSYAVGQFQECSVTCGSGVQLRSVTCQDNVGEAVAEVFCIQLGLFKPSTTQNCDTGISCGLRYVAGPYATCSVTCGSGTRTRMIYCVNGNNLVVALARCEDAQLASPSLTTSCEQEACPSPVYTALRGTWSECSVTCGLGTETRFVACRNNNVDVDVQNCIDAGLTDLETLRVCTRPTCQPEYRFEAGAFSDCSVTCGTGLRTRDVQCLDQDDVAVAIDNCLTIGLTPPQSTMECTLEDCPTYIYQVGEFGACTEECGDGLQLRAVVCVNNDTKAVVDDANCPGERPASTQPCNLMPCNTLLQFVTSPFSACNCSGLQTRIVICIQRVGTVLEQVSTQNCLDAGLEALPTTQDCPPPADCVQPNPVWQTTEWSQCPVTCGVGTQTRLVYCIAQPGSTDIVDDSECVAGDKPPTTQECDTEVVCPTAYLWLTYGWGACSVTCGEGFESRDVFCFSLGTNIVQVDDSLCNAGEKPNTVRPCSLAPCTASWTTSDWTECSVTCGPGTQTRTVACQQTKDPNSNVVDESECIAEARPSEARPCYLALCPAPFGCETSYMLEGTVQYTESSPGFTDGQNYPNDLECSKAFVAENNIQDGRRRRRRNVQEPQYCIQLTFTAFDVEPSTDCTVDYLEISDIRYNTSERLCGNTYELPLVWESVGPHVNLYFHTDATVTRPGYSVIYNAVEKQDPAGYEVTEWSECSVTCGEGVETREVLCVRGNKTVDDIECSGLQKPVSSQPCVEDECIEPSVCSGDLLRTENNAIILSPDFPSAYPNNISCSNIIRAPEGMIMEIFVTFFNLRPEECSDKVLIKDVNVDGEPLELCGNQAPGIVFTSITNEVTVQFESAETGSISPTGFGFSLRADFMNQPPVSCGNQISESGRAVYSPNYPGDYNLNENCLTVIRNDGGCIKLRFLDIDLPPQNGQCSDFVQLVDLNEIAVNTGPLCGREIPTVFYSFTGLMTVRFFSDENGPTDGGFNAVVNFVDCYEGVWLTGPFEECSATCGEAVRRRTVSCQNPQTDALVDPAMCPPEIPDEEIPCDVPECPSCDVTVTESGEIGSPNSPSNYDNNQRCETEIVNPDGCVAINFLAFDLQPGLSGECDTDFLEITDVAREEPIKLCGSTLPDTYQSLSGNVQLLFQTDESVVSTGYYAYVSFIPCPVNAYIVGNWSECSVTCGAGVRTRDVQCMDLINNVPVEDSVCQGERPPSEEPCMADEECPSCDVTITESLMFVTSPDFPNPYAPNLECVYTFNSPEPEQCVRLTIIEAYLNGADDNDLCSRDYLEITSQSGQPPLRFCPESARSIPWYSRDNTASVRFVTDEEGASSGFNMYVVFGSCPTYDFVVGDYSECSARCGGGVRTRVVSCISLSDGSGAPDELCPNQRPLDSIPCNTEPCPVCDAAFFPGDELIMSPDFSSAPGQGYERSLDCTYNITNPDGCLFLTFLSFELQECADCSCDYLSITEDNAEALPPLCGTQNDRTWASTTGNVMLNFVTDNSISAAGFNIYVAYVDCPDVYYFTGDYSECDVSCGGGTQTRLVQCRSRTTGMEVDESMCAGVKPPTERPCGEDPCPFCDEVITTPSFIASPEYPNNYPVSINCNYAIQAPAGRCVSINVLAFELQEAEGDPMMCQDYIEIRDQGAPTLDRRYCGLAAPNAIQWRSRFGSVSLDFSSDEEDTSSGFRAYVNFVDCPQYGYVATEFSMCSRPCGGGTQTREVSCINLATQQPADEVNCEDERPSESIPCNLQDCPECDEQITENRQSVYSLNFPQPYFEYSCNYIYTNPGGCVELLFVQFEMPIPNAEDVCDKDYLLVEDMSDRPFSYRICGPDIPNAVVSRGERLNVTLVTDGNPGTFGEGYQLYNLFTNNCPEVGYVASEFGECDRQCGFGTRTREVNCVDLQSGITVDESLCIDVEPSSTEFCNTQPCPSCDQVVDTFPIALNSPADLDPLRTCQYDIVSERCIRATFLTFDFPGENGMCADTFVQLQDEGAEFLTERFCGDGPGAASGAALYAWESRTSDVLMTLNSGTDLTADNRFRIFLTEMDCPEFGFVAGEFDECSRSCGEGGVQTRTVECQRLADNSPVEEGSCTDPKPSETRPCAPQPPCPSCDMFVSDPETLVQGPPRNSNWTTDVRCRITVEYDTSCVVISGLQVMLSEPDENGTCVDSSLTFFDGTYPAYTETVCGSSSGGVYRALTRRYVVDFYSADYENSGDSFNLFVQAAACPMIEYQTSEFSQCSASCGGGIRTRDVTCVRADRMEEVPDDACSGPRPTTIEGCNLEACPKECDNVITVNTPVQLLTSPGRPTYVTDADCTNNIINLSGCIVLAFLSVDIEEGTMPGVCDKDYLEIIDATFDELSVRLCGNTLPSTAWRSQSGSIRTRFVSDSVDTQQAGYTLTYTLTPTCPTGSYVLSGFDDCSATCGEGTRTAADLNCVLPDSSIGTNSDCPGLPPSRVESCNLGECPEFYFFTGEYSNCSVECGDGTQTRVVECRRLDNDTVVDDGMCTEVKPETSMACNLMACVDNAFVLSETPQTETVQLGESGTIQSPNYPNAYPNNLNAQVVLTIPANTLLRVTIDTLDLVFESPCANGDFLRFSSGSNTVLQVCQTTQLPFDWFSGAGDMEVTIAMTTSATNAGTGFMGRWTVIVPP